LSPDLGLRLHEVGIDPAAIGDPDAAFALLTDRFGPVITVADRYELEALTLGVDVAELPKARRDQLARAVTTLRFPGWEILGDRRNDPIEILPYDPQWPAVYESWRARLAEALGGSALRIEHVGSTAVPGLAAKAIIDIQISVADMTDEVRYVPAIEKVGVPLRARDDLHRYFRPAPGMPRDVQIHVCDEGSRWESDHLLFRDYLRANEVGREAYSALKVALAGRFHDDRLAYSDAKSEFILAALRDASS
jgi:GrpB-like predicted nucleotidyltransferase (UPF0157 family)